MDNENYEIYDDGRVYHKRLKRFIGIERDDGYIGCNIGKKKYLVHRLVWVKFRGDIPTHLEIDHINDIRDDNRLENLQLLTHAENCAKQLLMKSNTSGYIGISLEKSTEKWRAENRNNGKLKYLGLFKTAIEAAKFRDDFIIKNGFSHRLNFPSRRLDPEILNRLEKFQTPLKKGYTGVSFNKRSGKYEAYFHSKDFNGGKKKHLGNFNTAIEAARARDDFIIKNNLNHRLNFPISSS